MNEIIQVRHLKKYFKEVKAVDDVSFIVARGELFGFLGVNGAGKTTTINMLCTLLEPTDGEVWIDGLRLGKEDEEIKRRIGVVYQDNCLDNILTVKENLLLRGGLYEKDKTILKKNLHRVCEILDLTELLNRKYGKLSGGQKRKCEIARALMHTPDILFLDEPTTGLDPASRKSVWEAIGKLQKDMGMTVFLTTHYMEEAAKANHIAIMQNGQLTQYGTPFELKEIFAKDKLILVPKQEESKEIFQILDGRNVRYKQKENLIYIPIEKTLSAMPILEVVKDKIFGFEVIQGTMDDVFLNATKGGVRNE